MFLSFVTENPGLCCVSMRKRLRDQLKNLVWRLLKRKVFEPPLDLCPFFPIARTQRCSVLIECLMKDGDKESCGFLRICRRFSEFLKNEEIRRSSADGCMLKKLAELVDDQQKATSFSSASQ